ncbi:MAG: sigma-54 dependent transcriptional regulator [Candidatus Marinimicrobia bacterium]|nr:sigma-54 dependent transcriptional regulator [Candidatus Neomarinimicrobiota bacterium]MCF7840693.1 sigma-54 dependent transcriptional regulator [Candidatus Neomarinimicrobiota bacterium]MCF7902228.1 sigma-54 dependent transcriptional regulator [Candidatus Neomarinimicrobiota bacterium]
MPTILIVDDDPQIRAELTEFLQEEQYDTTAVETAEEALALIKSEQPDLILSDIFLPTMGGLELLDRVKKSHAEIDVIMITGHGDVSTAVSAMKLGARDYIKKPFHLDEILLVITRALQNKARDEQLAYLQREERKLLGFEEIIGTSPPMQQVFELIRKISRASRTTVLIHGETGTGKELVARAIHHNSERAGKPFVEINCSAFQPTLLEAELFGYEAGAFTGARQRKKGLLELADGGSFFLDEIADMSLELQAKMLKVLEEMTFRRVGGTKEIKIDIRVISATSKDLDVVTLKGSFRQDLYYRLNVARIALPSLRERGEDVIILAKHFLDHYNRELKRDIQSISPEVVNILRQYSWPGNVRELRNIMERAVLFEQTDTLTTSSLHTMLDNNQSQPVKAAAGSHPLELHIPPGGIALRAVEKQLIMQALELTGGNQTRAAELLKLTRETLKYRMRKFNLH